MTGPIPPTPSPPRGRLHFIDGLRGLASFYVLLFHESTIKVVGHGEPSRGMSMLKRWLSCGHFAVVFFIVLSGFSLMLPLARSGSTALVGGFGRYLYRRARRILPPYYAALLLSMAVLVVYNAMSARMGLGKVDDAALGPGSIISHLLLVHNLRFDWAYRINGPMWSVATEWQIYFIFPALLLPAWRRISPVATVALAWVVTSLPHFLLPADSNLFWACPWFVGSFALGMLGATLAFSKDFEGSALSDRVPWGYVTVALFVLLVVLVATGRVDAWPYPVVDLPVSLFAFSWINASLRTTEQQSFLLRLLGSRALVYLGGFSYSLYLVQHPLLRFTEKALGRLHVGYDAEILLHLLFATPIVMLMAWIFSELFERPFTSGGILVPAARRLFGMSKPEAS